MINQRDDDDILWEYMDRLRWRLRHLPKQQSAEYLREIRQHMQYLVADYVAVGATPEEAVRKAEEKFGSVEAVSWRLIQEYHYRRVLWLVFYHIPRVVLYIIAFLNTPNRRSGFDWETVLAAVGVGSGYGIVYAWRWDRPARVCAAPVTYDDRLGPQWPLSIFAYSLMAFFAVLILALLVLALYMIGIPLPSARNFGVENLAYIAGIFAIYALARRLVALMRRRTTEG